MSKPVHIWPESIAGYAVGWAVVSVSAIADNQIVAAVAGKRIAVLGYVLDASGGVNTATWKSGSSAIAGAMDLLADTPFSSGWNPNAWFVTAKGAALNLALTAATLVAGHVTYVLID